MLFYTYLYSSLLPNVYFLLILIFLFPLSLVITSQLFKIVLREVNLCILYEDNKANYTFNELFVLLKAFINKRLWFKSLELLEENHNILVGNMHQYFNAIGFIYYNMSQYNLAQLYYLKAVNLKEDYLIALQNLARLYHQQKKYMLAVSTYKSILLYDKHNLVACHYLQKQKTND